MRAILVDDERLGLKQLQMMLESVEGVEIIGAYQDPVMSYRAVKELLPDVVFLDIQMPEIDGLEAGMRIQEAVPGVEIVFVTAHDQYAVQAFEMNALDYIMKPLQKHRLENTVARIRKRMEAGSSEESASGLPRLCFMNNIRVQWPGKSPEILKWRTAKAKELFAYLFHYRGRTISKEALMELLWPDTELPKSMQLLYTTVYQIRRSLKQYGIGGVSIDTVNFTDGYMLDLGMVPNDIDEWEEELKKLKPPNESNVKEHEHVLSMYEGDYLGDSDYLWAEQERERLRRQWMDGALALSEYYIRMGLTHDAIRIHHHIQRIDPVYEDSYFAVMKLYASLHNRAAVKEQYELLVWKLEQELDAAPSKQIEEWYRNWLKEATER